MRLRHGLMERGVEHGDHRHIRPHDLAACLNADQVGRVVERRERHAVLNRLEYLFRDNHAVREELAAMHHAVTDRVDLAHRGDHALFRIEQNIDDRLDRLGMGRHRRFDAVFLLGFISRMRQHTVDTDALAKALCHDRVLRSVEQLILQRGTAGVDDQNFHLPLLP